LKNLLEYNGYLGTVEFSSEDNVLFGKVVGINGLVSYEGISIDDLREGFQEAVDDYLEMCAEANIEPQKSYKGSFNIRISPELHKSLSVISTVKNISLNKAVEEAIAKYVSSV